MAAPRRVALKMGLGLLVSVLCLGVAFWKVSFEKLDRALHNVDFGWLAVAVCISLLIQVFRAFRWQLELRPLAHVPLPRLWIVTSVAYMAINVLPARMGEFVRPWLLSRTSKVSFSNVVGNIVVEKTVDSLVLLFYILIGLMTAQNLPEKVRHGAIVPFALACVLVALVILVWKKGEAFVDRWVVGRLPEKIGHGVRRVVLAILDGMRILPDVRLLGAVFAVSLVLWFLPILSSYIMIQAFDIDAPFSAAVVVFIFIGAATALPQGPAMVGTYQWACILALELFGVDRATGLAYGLVLNAVQFLTLVAQGLIAFPFAGVTLGEIKQAKYQASERMAEIEKQQRQQGQAPEESREKREAAEA